MMRRIAVLFLILLSFALGATAASDAASSKGHAGAAASTKTDGILPPSFAGWQLSGTAKPVAKASDLDGANPAVLQEFHFNRGELASYTREGHKLDVKAVQFDDASGAFGTYTFYRTADMLPQSAGDAAVSSNGHVLFCRGNLLIEANFERPTGMSISELRELAAELPETAHEARVLPNLTNYLPQQQLNRASIRYIEGPAALRAAKLPANLADFSANAEVAAGEYKTSDGIATLAVISYPTPQVANAKLHDLQLNGDLVASRRSGPLVAVVLGSISKSDAQSLTESVNYDATVTWNERTSFTGRDNIGNLIVGVFTLIGVLLVVALGGGMMVGGSRMVLRKLGKIHPDEEEVIKLNLH